MAKFKFKDAAMIALGATGGAYIADWANDMIDEKVEDEKVEIGVKLLAVGACAYVASTQKGLAQTASISALGQFGKGVTESARAMMGGSKPTKGIDEEIGAIYDELEEAMKGTETVTGSEAAVTGNQATVTGSYFDDQFQE